MGSNVTDETSSVTYQEDLENVKDVQPVGDIPGPLRRQILWRLHLELDIRIMPTVSVMYFMNYLDRNAIANTRLDGLEDGLGLVGPQFLFIQVPSNMLLSSNKIQPSLYIGVCMGAWAIISTLRAVVKNYTGFVMVRFFLGVAEAPFYPGALYLLGIFYNRKELATRTAILYSGNIFATSFAGLIAAVTFPSIDGAQGLKGWQWLFIIEGVVTFAIALIAMILLPDQPSNTKWLTPEERILADEPIKRDTVGLAPSKSARAGFPQAIRDPHLYLLCFIQNMYLSACSFNNFFPTVIGSLGFGRTITLALTCPPYLISGFVGYFVGLTSGRLNEWTWHITISMGFALAGFIIPHVTMNTAARCISCFLFASGAYAVNSVILGWLSATLGQTTEKKAASLSIVNVIANASYIYTASLYRKRDGPKYFIGMDANSGFAFATIAGSWTFRIWLQRTNKKIRASGDETQVFYNY